MYIFFNKGVSATLAALTPRLKDFHQLLVDPPPVSLIGYLYASKLCHVFSIIIHVIVSLALISVECPYDI